MYNGIIPVYKEKGYTSFDVVACLRKILNQKKIGHTGTLDPDACGVLPVCLGNATKLVEMITASEKEYRAKMLLGVRTDTQDISGNIISEKQPVSDAERIKEVLNSFVGEYSQVPPMYSALKVDGKKLCDLARQGITVERKPRKVMIYDISIHNVSGNIADFTVRCSKGTYIRTLIDDAGELLGCGACMKELLRISSGGFTLKESYNLSEIKGAVNDGNINDLLIPTEAFFKDNPKLSVKREYDKLLYNGNNLYPEMFANELLIEEKDYRVYDSNDIFYGIYTPDGGRLKIKYYFGSN